MSQQSPLNLAPGTPSSINDLPFETLSWILQLGMEATPSYELHQYIARVSSVSRYWRDVATQTTDLWTILDPKQPLPVLNTYIHRSGQAPLILATYHGGVPDELVVLPVDRANAILAHASRIIDLDLTMKRTDYPAIVSSLSQLSNSAESLSLYLVEDDDDITTDDDEEEEETYSPPVLPGNIFGGNQPHNFCELSLSGCRIDWTSPLLHHLVKLCLDSQVQPTWQTLYDVLSQQPELEILRLDGCLPLPDPASGDLIPCIPTLSELNIIDDYDNCLWFLRHMKVQVSYLYVDCDAMGANSGHELMSTCVEILQDTCSGNPLTDLEIITETIDGVNLRLAGHQRNPGGSGDVTKFDVAFIYEAGTPLHQHITQLLPVITTNKIAKIISLECDFHPGSSLSFWLAVHEAVFMPDLVELKLMSTSALTTYMDACLVMMKRYQDWTGTVSSLRPLPQAQQVFAEWGCLPSCYYSICTDVSRLAAIPAQPLVPDDFDMSKEFEDISLV